MVDTYGLGNDDFTEELEEAVADIQDTLEADNYEDQLPQPEVNYFTFFFNFNSFFVLFVLISSIICNALHHH